MPSVNVPQAVWDLAKQISGLKNPGAFLRNDVLIPWAITHATPSENTPDEPLPLDESPDEALDKLFSRPLNEPHDEPHDIDRHEPRDDDLLRRKARLNCVDNSFDPYFAAAWAWACNEFGDERTLVEFLEDQTTLPQGRMTNPRGVIIARWRNATKPNAS